MTSDGLTSTFTARIMDEENSVVSAEIGCSRADQDAWALRSHERAIAAIDAGRMAEEIAPVDRQRPQGRDHRRHRRGATARHVARAAGGSAAGVRADGATTAGNSPGVNDGAAALVLASDEWAAERGLTPLARIRRRPRPTATTPYLVRTPAGSARQALDRAGLAVADVDLFEINEAFCSVALHSVTLLGADPERVQRPGRRGRARPPDRRVRRPAGRHARPPAAPRAAAGSASAAICSGGGQGDAIVIEVPGRERRADRRRRRRADGRRHRAGRRASPGYEITLVDVATGQLERALAAIRGSLSTAGREGPGRASPTPMLAGRPRSAPRPSRSTPT